jgi:hypothetical protein
MFGKIGKIKKEEIKILLFYGY